MGNKIMLSLRDRVAGIVGPSVQGCFHTPQEPFPPITPPPPPRKPSENDKAEMVSQTHDHWLGWGVRHVCSH